ncbi:hypothetical protein F7725_024337 [Dissostichus mawsoni]|uniref:Uncharacterized protein n=1 Tax=Dissostichus mawsoni TaxID=36200 RepID=A0A7J5XZ47_DISMA|nr:hypothetical protein F7725_024337 [Dissostichus mawsoni]
MRDGSSCFCLSVTSSISSTLFCCSRCRTLSMNMAKRSLRQIQGVCGHRRVGAADPPVQAHGGGETVAGPGHGAEPRGAPGGGAAHARGGDGNLGESPKIFRVLCYRSMKTGPTVGLKDSTPVELEHHGCSHMTPSGSPVLSCTEQQWYKPRTMAKEQELVLKVEDEDEDEEEDEEEEEE